MSTDTLEATIENLIDSNLVHKELLVNWHAGEPLVLGPEYYEEAVPRLNRLAAAGTVVQHSLQTNGMLVTPRFCELFLNHDIRIGVSIDGPDFLHDKFRRTRNNRPTHAATMKGVKLLQNHGIQFNVICVVTNATLDYPDDLYDFFLENGMGAVALNLDELEGSNLQTSMAHDGYGARFVRFMSRLYERCVLDKQIVLREFHEMEDAILQPIDRSNSHTVPFVNLTIGFNGDYSTFSPELLGHNHDAYDDFVFGNVHSGLIRDSVKSPNFAHVYSDILEGVNQCKDSCDYFDICMGGCPSNKLFENGTFASSDTLHCRNKVWSVADLVIDKLEAGMRHI